MFKWVKIAAIVFVLFLIASPVMAQDNTRIWIAGFIWVALWGRSGDHRRRLRYRQHRIESRGEHGTPAGGGRKHSDGDVDFGRLD